ncbi:MAG: hypothetical protein V7765_22080, partial [Oleispira sp.]
SLSNRDKNEYESLATAVGTTIITTSKNWEYTDLEALLHPQVRDVNNFEHLYREGTKLGGFDSCKEGEFEKNAFPEIPTALKYSGICQFKNGSAKVFILFSMLKDLNFVVFTIDMFPIEET